MSRRGVAIGGFVAALALFLGHAGGTGGAGVAFAQEATAQETDADGVRDATDATTTGVGVPGPSPAATATGGYPPSVDGLYVVPSGVRAYQISSYDRSGGNDDGNRAWAYLDFHREDRLFTIFRAAGPGRLVRFWMTGWRNPGELAFRVDGKVAATVPVADLFAGSVPPFAAPAVGDDTVSSGGFYSYVPITYDGELSIETASVSRYIQMQYYRYADAAARRREDTRAAVLDTSASEPQTAWFVVPSLGSGQSGQVFRVRGGGVVDRVVVTLPKSTVAAVATMAEVVTDDIYLLGFADGATDPQIEAPLSEIFGGALAGDAFSTAAGGVAETADGRVSFSLNLPIPFGVGFRLEIANRGPTVIPGIETEVTYRRLPPMATLIADGTIGHLYAVHRRQTARAGEGDVEFVDFDGAGRLVGVSLVVSSDDPENRRILEGDDRIYIDGSPTPQIHGTGTEDFFNGGWYYSNGPFALATHGHPAHLVDAAGDHTSQYRFLLNDSVPFASRIRMTMEHGPTNDLNGVFSSTVFLYARKRPAIGSSTYLTAEEVATGAPTAGFDAPLVGTDAPAALESWTHRVVEEPFVFDAAVDPDNAGILLRRLTDYTLPNQSAEVYVNDRYAGVWLTPGFVGDPGVIASEFIVSGDLTKGHAKAVVEIRPQTPWSIVDMAVYLLSR